MNIARYYFTMQILYNGPICVLGRFKLVAHW